VQRPELDLAQPDKASSAVGDKKAKSRYLAGLNMAEDALTQPSQNPLQLSGELLPYIFEIYDQGYD
jgi:hypothetical protein